MTHTCKFCGVTSDVAEFYKGLNSRCKECHKLKVRENRAEKAEYYRIYDAYRYQFDPKVKKRHVRYRKTEEGKASMAQARNKWLRHNDDKRAAHIIVKNAIRSGRITKPDTCESCGASGRRIEGHHDDYARPLDVKWVCRSCHVAIHRDDDERLSLMRDAALNFTADLKFRGKPC